MQKIKNITGWVLSVAIGAIFSLAAFMDLSGNPMAAETLTKIGYPAWFPMFIGVMFLVAVVLYLVPRTAYALFGAILLTGYFGGIIATHFIMGDGQWWTRAIMGVIVWLALYLRDARFNALMSVWRTGRVS